MTGWFDYYKQTINCPFCNKQIEIVFVENGEISPEIVITLEIAGGKSICPECNKIIKKKDIKELNQ